MKELDARGLSCPQPVLLLAEAMKSGEKEFKVLVDDFAPLENVTRYAQNHGCTVKHQDKGDYTEILCQR